MEVNKSNYAVVNHKWIIERICTNSYSTSYDIILLEFFKESWELSF